MKTVLVTGSEGNIGSYIVKRLQQCTPHLLTLRVSRSSNPSFELTKHEKFYSGDLNDGNFVNKIFSENKIDFVIHAAAERYSVHNFQTSPYLVMRNDVRILENVLDSSWKVKKISYISSSTVYESSATSPFTEEQTEHIAPPVSPYGIAKHYGERLLQAFHLQSKVPYTIWRAFNVVSPLEAHELGDGHVFVNLYKKIFSNRDRTIEIFGSGNQVRCFTWVEDVAHALVDFLGDDRTKNQVFNIGNNEPIAVRDLILMMVEIGKAQKLLPEEYSPHIATGAVFSGIDSQVRIPSIAKIESLLGWKPHTPLRECFENFVTRKESHDYY